MPSRVLPLQTMPIQQIAVRPLAVMKDIKTNANGSNKMKDSAKVAMETMHANAVVTRGSERCESQLSTTSNGGDMCRICHCESEPNNALISPCLCSGSLKFVHLSCLQKWIKSSEKNVCELCKFQYIMTTKTKPFKQWEKLEMSSAERRKIICSVTFHMIAITCVIWSLYVLIDRTTEEVANGNLNWPFWTKLIVVAIGFTGGLVFMYVQCKMYFQLCMRWRAYNRVIHIENAPEDPAVRAQLAARIKESSSEQEDGGLTNTAAFNDLEMF